VLITGFVLMPKAGLRNAFNLLALVLCVPALLIALNSRRRALAATAVVFGAGLIVSCMTGNEGWRHVLGSGAFRSREPVVSPNTFKARKQFVKILFYEDAADATVSVEGETGKGLDSDIGLRINGKAEASTKGDLTTQLLLAHLPMFARPDSEDIFVLGLASGISCSGFLAYHIKQLTVADNCEPVTRAVDFFGPWNRGVKTNPVTRLRIEDARTVLKLEPKAYDVIMSEPSNPWFASIGSVFSREFYELAAKRLKPGGIMVQWFHIYEMHDGIVEMVLRTFNSVFPVMEIWDTNEGDIILLGSDRPWNMTIESLRQSYTNEKVRKDMESIGLNTPEALLARLFASQRTAPCIAGPGPIQTDGFPVLEYEAPVAFFVGTKATGILRFDERTWQGGFASEERRRALTGLDDEALHNVFSHDTINRELWLAVIERLKRNHLTVGKEKSITYPSPCIFDRAADSPEKVLPPNASESLAALVRARVELQNGEGDFNKNADLVRHTLAAQIIATGAKTPEKGSANFAAVAARAAIVRGEFDLAGDFLALGMKFDAADPELSYLARLREREVAAQSGPAAR